MPTSPTLSPYLAVADARAALAFYVEAFGAVPRGQVYEMEDGRIGHAEVLVGDTVLMLADEYPEIGLLGPLARGGSTTSLHLTVPDVDAVVARAVAAGATLEREVADAAYGRTGVVLDPAGHRWMVQTPPASSGSSSGTDAGRHGHVGYQTLYVPDVERTKSFFGEVLGWTYTGGDAEGGWEAEGVVPMTGLMGGAPRPEVQLCFQVDDVRDGVQRGGRGGRHGIGARGQAVRPAGRVRRRPGDALPAVAATLTPRRLAVSRPAHGRRQGVGGPGARRQRGEVAGAPVDAGRELEPAQHLGGRAPPSRQQRQVGVALEQRS
jgi:uncharacterized glyoxalase superfamily protein PhnB